MNTTQLELGEPRFSTVPTVLERTDGTCDRSDQLLEECNQVLRKLARYLKDPAVFAEFQEHYFKPVRRNIRRQNMKASLRRLDELEECVAMLGIVIRRSRIRPPSRRRRVL